MLPSALEVRHMRIYLIACDEYEAEQREKQQEELEEAKRSSRHTTRHER
jgi:hypothetical protein